MFGGSKAHLGSKTDDHRMLNLAYWLYFLSVFTVGSSVIGVVVAYIERGRAVADVNRSHATWQIRTFWLTLALSFISIFVVFFLSVATDIALSLLAIPLTFFVCRTVKGWYVLDKIRAIEKPTALL